ncbi:MAG: hypothetical protein AMXMBFR84_12580 [Candidatus Hydrogenedentota bacterium]
MNALVESQLAELRSAVQALEEFAEERGTTISKLEEERDALQQEQWRLKKNLTTLERKSKRLEALEAQNGRMKELIADLRERLHATLKDIKALRSGIAS